LYKTDPVAKSTGHDKKSCIRKFDEGNIEKGKSNVKTPKEK